MAIAVVQSARMTTFSTAPSLAFGSNNTAGNVLVCLFYFNGAATPTVTDTRGNTWNLVGTKIITNGGAGFVFAYVCLSCAAGANTVSVNTGGSNGAIGLILEASGFTSPATENYSTNNLGTSTGNSNSITPNAANSLILTIAQGNGASGSTLSAPFSNPGSGAGSFCQAGWIILTSAAATHSSWTGLGTSGGGSSTGIIIFDIISAAAAVARNVTINIWE